MRIYLGLGLAGVACLGALLAASCSSSTTLSSGADASPDGGAPTLAACLAGAVSSAPPPACAPLVQCLEGSCESSLSTCFGDFEGGTVGGACAGFETCAMQSACTTDAGVACAEQSSTTCQADLQTLYACASTSCATQFSACENGLLNGLGDAGAPSGNDAGHGLDSSVGDSSVDAGSDATVTDASSDASEGGSYVAPDSSSDASSETFNGAYGIVVDKFGYVLVASWNGVFVYGPPPAYPFVQQVLPLQSEGFAEAGVPLLTPNLAQSIAIDSTGHVLVANYYEGAGSPGCYYDPPTSYGSDIASYVDNSSSATPPALSFDTILIGNPNSTTLGCANAVAVAPSGTIFVSVMGELLAFNPTGAQLASVLYPAGANTAGIAVDPTSSFVYVTDANNGVVYQYKFEDEAGTPALSLALTITPGGDASPEPECVAVDGSGSVYVANRGVIDIYSSAGTQTGGFTTAGCGCALAFDSAGRLYQGCGSSIAVYEKQSGGTWTSDGGIQ